LATPQDDDPTGQPPDHPDLTASAAAPAAAAPAAPPALEPDAGDRTTAGAPTVGPGGPVASASATSGPGNAQPVLASTVALLQRYRTGDDAARDLLLARYLPMLRRWAHGRLPLFARGLADTDDLVQVTLLRALKHMGSFEPRREGAFLAYLRRILLNAIREEIRRTARRPSKAPLDEELPEPNPWWVEQDTFEAYEKALAALPQAQQEAVILRVEFGYTHQEIADAIGSPSANAARMFVARALVRLAEAMNDLD
jgi:RNA polymerase sigma factor (sigma-70 family)